MEEQKQCPYDKSWFAPHRSNQIYASRENQIAHKNERVRKEKELTKQKDNALKKNRRICEVLVDAEKKEVVVTKDYLSGSGFTFSVFNGSAKVEGVVATCIYEFYVKRENEQFKIGRLDGKY